MRRATTSLLVLLASSWATQAADVEGKVSSASGHSLRDVVISLEGKDLPVGKPPIEPALMDQKDVKFVPHVLPIVKGTTVRFLNSDETVHNVQVRGENLSQNLGTYPKGQEKRVTFEATGVVELTCNVHQEMYGIILVLPNAFFTRPAPDGTFTLLDVPAGEHEIVVSVPEREPLRQKVTVGKRGSAHVDLSLP